MESVQGRFEGCLVNVSGLQRPLLLLHVGMMFPLLASAAVTFQSLHNM